MKKQAKAKPDKQTNKQSMTKEEAITILSNYDLGFYDINGHPIPQLKLAEACDMAIEALSADTILHESCEDCPLYDHERHSCPRFNKVIPRTITEAIRYWPRGGDTATPIVKRYCMRKQVMCEYANEMAYCKVTACVYPNNSNRTYTSNRTNYKGGEE